jgi:peptide/nickel transport system substrate-binding protein
VNVRLMKKVVSIFCALSLGGGLLAACTSKTSKAASSSATEANATLVMTPAASGPFTDAFNPFLPTVATTSGHTSMLIYEPLIYANYAKNALQPWLATAWEWSNGGKTLTLTIRKGVDWSDGTPFSAKDVAFTFNLIRTNPALNKGALPLLSATAPSTTKVVLTFSQPEYSNLREIGDVDPVPEHLWKNVKDPATYPDADPVGTGPYELKTFTPQVITLVKNPHYWQAGEPAVHTVRAVAFDSAASIQAALESGQTDWTGNVFSDSASLIKANPHLRVETVPYVTVPIVLNFTRYPLNLLPVRQAISDALDRQAVVTDGLRGYGDTPITSPTGLLPSMASSITSAYKSAAFTFSVAKAKSTLESAGFKMGSNGIFVSPNGTPLTLTMLIPATFANWLSVSQYLTVALKSAGIGFTVQTLTVVAWREALRLGTFDVSLDNQAFLTPYGFYKFYLDGGDTAPIGKNANEDYGRYNNPTVTAALAAYAAAVPGSPASTNALATLERIQVTQLPIIPLFINDQMATYNAAKFTGFPKASNPYAIPTPYDDIEAVLLHIRPVGS